MQGPLSNLAQSLDLFEKREQIYILTVRQPIFSKRLHIAYNKGNLPSYYNLRTTPILYLWPVGLPPLLFSVVNQEF